LLSRYDLWGFTSLSKPTSHDLIATPTLALRSVDTVHKILRVWNRLETLYLKNFEMRPVLKLF